MIVSRGFDVNRDGTYDTTCAIPKICPVAEDFTSAEVNLRKMNAVPADISTHAI